MGGPVAPRRRSGELRMRTKPSLDLADAEAMAAACRAQAQALGARVTIAVVDEAGGLIHLQRLDGAKAYSVDLAGRKARTAAAVGVSTAIIAERAPDGRLVAGDFLPLAGGLPILHDGQCAGAVGVSGASAGDDERIAAAGVAALG
jgi:glc operon protein GlcG